MTQAWIVARPPGRPRSDASELDAAVQVF